MFSQACVKNSVHRMRVCMVKGQYVAKGECMVKGGVCGKGGACVMGVCMAGGMHGRRDSYSSGRYASYWNAFLLALILLRGNLGK